MTRGTALMEMLSDVDDPRQPSNGTRHDFLEMLVMTISAVLSDCDTIEDVAACRLVACAHQLAATVPHAQKWGSFGRHLSAGLPSARPETV